MTNREDSETPISAAKYFSINFSVIEMKKVKYCNLIQDFQVAFSP